MGMVIIRIMIITLMDITDIVVMVAAVFMVAEAVVSTVITMPPLRTKVRTTPDVFQTDRVQQVIEPWIIQMFQVQENRERIYHQVIQDRVL